MQCYIKCWSICVFYGLLYIALTETALLVFILPVCIFIAALCCPVYIMFSSCFAVTQRYALCNYMPVSMHVLKLCSYDDDVDDEKRKYKKIRQMW